MKKIFSDMAILFILPGFLGFVLFYILPFFISLNYSFLSSPISGTFVGFKNYIELFHSKSYLLGAKNTVIFVLIIVPLNMVFSLLVALLINNIKKYKESFTLIFLIPLVIPSGATVFFWRLLFSNTDWLINQYAMLVAIIIFLWKNIGYNMILYIAGINNIPKEYYESAKVDGGSRWQCFKNITLVFLMPTIVLTLIMTLINSFKVFKEIYLLVGSYPNSNVYMLQHFINNTFASLNYQKLTAATTVLTIIIALLALGLFKLERKILREI